MDIIEDLNVELERIEQQLTKANLLDLACCQGTSFLEIINNSEYFVTIHDVEFYRPICINEGLRIFYNFKNQVMKGMDHFYYLRTIHTSTYHALIESIAFFRNDTPGVLELKYKLLHGSGTWKNMVGVSRCIIRNKRNLPKVAITVMKETNCTLADSTYEKFKSLTERELEIVSKLVNGASKKEIAAELNIALGTVGTHVKNIYKKLGVRKMTELAKIIDLFTLK